MNKLRNFYNGIRNDGTDFRKNDLWRILLFALNNSGGVSIMHLVGKWAYYTQNVLQLGVFLASVILPMRLLDAITDPIIANRFDKFDSKHGKFRPFMLLGGLMSFLPAIVIFCYPVHSGLPLAATYAILSVMYGIIVIGNTILMTATRAGQAVITQDPKQRPVYALGQTVFDAIIMSFVSLMITGNLVSDMQEPLAWRVSVLVLSAVSVFLIVIAMQAIKTRDNKKYYTVSSKDKKPSFAEFFLLIKRNKVLRRLLWATASDAIAASVRANLTIYLFANIIMQRRIAATFDIVTGVALGAPIVLAGIFFATRKGTAFVYKKVAVIQVIISAAGFLATLIFIPPVPGAVYEGFTCNVFIVLLIFGLYMSTLGVSTNLVNAMTGDLADYEYCQSGKFIPGTIGATLTFVNKIITSIVGFVVMGIMLFCGFSSAGADSVVPEDVFVNYRFYYSILVAVFLFPAAGHLVTCFAMWKYPLTDAKMREISLALAEKRKGSAAADLPVAEQSDGVTLR